MVWCRCAALGPVVEDHQLGIVGEQLVHLADVLLDALRHMLILGNGEVCGQDGERVDKQREPFFQGYLYLLLGSVLGAEETGAFLQRLLVYFGSRRYHTGWVEL